MLPALARSLMGTQIVKGLLLLLHWTSISIVTKSFLARHLRTPGLVRQHTSALRGIFLTILWIAAIRAFAEKAPASEAGRNRVRFSVKTYRLVC